MKTIFRTGHQIALRKEAWGKFLELNLLEISLSDLFFHVWFAFIWFFFSGFIFLL